MPVTELAWIPSATPGCVSPALVEAICKGIEAQSEWAAKHASSTLPAGPPAARGAALYRQREDPGVALVTAHWDSPAQHVACIGSEENRGAMQAIARHAVAEGVRFFHVEGAWMFGPETLEAGRPLLSVVRIGVEGGDEARRARVERIWEGKAKGVVDAWAGVGHCAGWRVEKEVGGGEARDEFVVVGAWRDGDALSRFVGDGMAEWDEVWGDVALEMDVKTYSRIA
ncbi:hypothetical protein F5Y14DRAFT_13880 [Nemania sp. NC0429]|nr:hypothetical protein F5Y14DRAFT_13880 [Nemania sp. NC0429]